MKLLITQREMRNFGGSQIYTAEIARGLSQRGHEVAIYCPKPGRISKLVSPSGILVRDRPEDLPWVPDLIHGHQHLPLMAALAHFPDTPAIHCWHGARPWVERVPLHPRIRLYAVTSARMAPQISAEHGVPEERIVTIPNFVDTERFSDVRSPARPMRRAVLYGHGGFAPAELRALESACHANGLTLDKIGQPYGNPRPRPEYFLPDYDLAFAIGRCALEAMACGCAVIPVVPQLAGNLITRDTLENWSASNYSPRYFTTAQRISAPWLGRELSRACPEAITATTAEVRARFPLSLALRSYEALYDRALSSPGFLHEASGFAPYLGWLADEVDDMWSNAEHHAAAQAALSDRNAQLQAQLTGAERQVRHLMQTLLAQKGVNVTPAKGTSGELRKRIAASGLFDSAWYLATYPEVAEAGMDPILHYLDHGAHEGRRPAPDFDPEAYLEANPHLRGLGISPVEHMLRQLETVAQVQSVPRLPDEVEMPNTAQDGIATLTQADAAGALPPLAPRDP